MLSIKNRQDIFRISTWVMILGGLMLTAIAFAVVRDWERQKLQSDFSIAVENRYAALEREVKSGIEVLSSIRAFYLHAKVVTRSEFHNFAESLLLKHPGIQALEWIPHVPYSQREEYEKAAQRDGFKDFQITEQSARDKIVKAGKRSEYFPVYFVEPYKGNESALGYDLASDPLRRETLERSRDTGGIAATARITLVQEEKGQSGFLVIYPVYKRNMPVDSSQNRKNNIRGFAVGVFRIHDIIKRSFTYLNPEGIDVYLYDNSAQGKERFLHFHPAHTRETTDSLHNEEPAPDGGLNITRTLKVADREWQILFVATPDYIARGKTWQPWGVLLAGLFLTGLLAGFSIVVDRRAEELTKSNELLLQEIAGRRKTEEALRLSEEKYRWMLDNMTDVITVMDMNLRFTYVSPSIMRMRGYTAEEAVAQTFEQVMTPESLKISAKVFEEEMRLEASGTADPDRIRSVVVEQYRKDGSIVSMENHLSFMRDEAKKPVGIISVSHDITERKRAESEIQALARFPSENPNPVLRIARNGTLLYANEAGLSQLPDWHLNVGQGVPFMIRDFVTEAMTSGKTRLFDIEHRGQVYSFFIAPIADAGYANMYGRDITDRKQAEDELRLSEERFRRIFDEGPFGMSIEKPDRTIIAANKALCELLGYTEQELAGQNIADITYEEDREKSKELLGQLFANSTPVFRLEKRYVRKDGTILWANTTISAIHGKEGNVLYGLAIIEDLTARQQAKEKIHLLSYYDKLTGLPNRAFYKELVERSIEHAQRHKEIFALIYIGLDNFKRINDTLGHSVGDLLLKAVADRLTNTLRKSDYVARSAEHETVNVVSRIGGDEFIVLAQDLNQAQDAARTSRRLLEEMSAPYDLRGREVFITVSIGISLYPDDGTDVDDLLKNAEKAMRYTKSEGKNRYHFYSSSMHSSVMELLTMENDLHRALERNELVLYYQPKVDAATRVVMGMEALIRWNHPDRGLIPPMQFIPIAETSGLILPIGEFVIRTVCGQIKTWQEAGYQQINIALNISGRQFDQQNLIEIVKDALRDTMISPQCLELEITESIIMRNPEKAIRILTELNALGIRISIDDFGTGYSSLSYLKRLPLDFLKIDQSFVKGLASDPKDQAIVKTIIAMAHSLNLKTIAEGVETEEQLSFLQEHGCDEIQGYLFSRPLPTEEIQGILAKGYL
jgi:diguanylate cyclase (GGDEF)-like protein/PAS domain S-box-containing protein